MMSAMIALGYLFKRRGLISADAEVGLNAYVYSIGLPSLLFTSLASASFENIDYNVVVAIMAAKLLLVVMSSIFGWLLTKPVDGTGGASTLGGMIALLSTMSDDVAIGYPIFSTYFSKANTEIVTLHIFVLSALQSLIINPVCFVLFGIGKVTLEHARANELAKILSLEVQRPGRFQVLVGVFKQLATNLLVLSSAAGVLYNLMFDAAPLPWMVNDVLSTASLAFLPLVLVASGMASCGSLNHLTSLRLTVLPTSMVVLKTVMLPVLAMSILRVLAPREAFELNQLEFPSPPAAPPVPSPPPTGLHVLGFTLPRGFDFIGNDRRAHDALSGPEQRIRLDEYMRDDGAVGLEREGWLEGGASDFVFLYSMLPVASSALAIVRRYEVEESLMGCLNSALLLGKVLAFGLLLLAANVVTYGFASSAVISDLQKASQLMHLLSFLASIGTGAVLLRFCRRDTTSATEVKLCRHVLVLVWLQTGFAGSALVASASIMWVRSDYKYLIEVTGLSKDSGKIVLRSLFAATSMMRWASFGWMLSMTIEQAMRVIEPFLIVRRFIHARLGFNFTAMHVCTALGLALVLAPCYSFLEPLRGGSARSPFAFGSECDSNPAGSAAFWISASLRPWEDMCTGEFTLEWIFDLWTQRPTATQLEVYELVYQAAIVLLTVSLLIILRAARLEREPVVSRRPSLLEPPPDLSPLKGATASHTSEPARGGPARGGARTAEAVARAAMAQATRAARGRSFAGYERLDDTPDEAPPGWEPEPEPEPEPGQDGQGMVARRSPTRRPGRPPSARPSLDSDYGTELTARSAVRATTGTQCNGGVHGNGGSVGGGGGEYRVRVRCMIEGGPTSPTAHARLPPSNPTGSPSPTVVVPEAEANAAAGGGAAHLSPISSAEGSGLARSVPQSISLDDLGKLDTLRLTTLAKPTSPLDPNKPASPRDPSPAFVWTPREAAPSAEDDTTPIHAEPVTLNVRVQLLGLYVLLRSICSMAIIPSFIDTGDATVLAANMTSDGVSALGRPLEWTYTSGLALLIFMAVQLNHGQGIITALLFCSLPSLPISDTSSPAPRTAQSRLADARTPGRGVNEML